ncbi:MAG: hypothetical protein LBL97_00095 [Prevotellaceae bacterium]|jgi:hypothetical protein|nr:hypothetical protein [Prevotellaceae bacterium]
MKLDIFSTTCFEHRKGSFGIYDEEEDGKEKNPAIIVPIEDERRIASVKNENRRDVFYVPLDKSISLWKDVRGKESLCDVLLIVIYPEQKYGFYLVELKDKGRSWLNSGIAQLSSTISIMERSYFLSCLIKKVAYLANKKHPKSNHSHMQKMEEFRRETGFRLIIGTEVKIEE